jgi:hypothetical protein
VLEVDLTTLAFGPDGAAPAHKKGGHFEDVNGDGLTDLVSHYRTGETGIEDGGACVIGETLDGVSFKGCDSVSMLSLIGTGAGGSVTLTIDGVTVTVPTFSGQSAAAVIATLVSEISSNEALQAQGTAAGEYGTGSSRTDRSNRRRSTIPGCRRRRSRSYPYSPPSASRPCSVSSAQPLSRDCGNPRLRAIHPEDLGSPWGQRGIRRVVQSS